MCPPLLVLIIVQLFVLLLDKKQIDRLVILSGFREERALARPFLRVSSSWRLVPADGGELVLSAIEDQEQRTKHQ